MLLWLAMIVGSAIVLHLGIERPFLALRDRYAARGRLRARTLAAAEAEQSWKEPAGIVVPSSRGRVAALRVSNAAADGLQPAIGE
jgi:peptidoglycan/LPS O-acetylase OafA/YrhL